MKISNQQLEALVNKIYDEKKSKNKPSKTFEDLKKDKANIALSKKYRKIISAIPDKILKDLYIDKSESAFLTSIVRLQYKEPKEISKSAIRQAIVISTIESDTLSDLMSKINKMKF